MNTAKEAIDQWLDEERRKEAYVPRNVICIVVERDVEHRPTVVPGAEMEMLKAMRTILQLMPLRITGLSSSFYTDIGGRILQKDFQPWFEVRELTDKVITKTVRHFAQFAQNNRVGPKDVLTGTVPVFNTFDLVFIEPNHNFTEAVDAWRMNGVYVVDFKGIDGVRDVEGLDKDNNIVRFALYGQVATDTSAVLKEAKELLNGINLTGTAPSNVGAIE